MGHHRSWKGAPTWHRCFINTRSMHLTCFKPTMLIYIHAFYMSKCSFASQAMLFKWGLARVGHKDIEDGSSTRKELSLHQEQSIYQRWFITLLELKDLFNLIQWTYTTTGRYLCYWSEPRTAMRFEDNERPNFSGEWTLVKAVAALSCQLPTCACSGRWWLGCISQGHSFKPSSLCCIMRSWPRFSFHVQL